MFWVASSAKRPGPTDNDTTTEFWTCYTDGAPTNENGPWYSWEYGGPGGPMMATLHDKKPPKGRKNVVRYQNPMRATEEKGVLLWFDTIIAAGIALQAERWPQGAPTRRTGASQGLKTGRAPRDNPVVQGRQPRTAAAPRARGCNS